jgi:4-hydroxy-tetrahydrodipicolinate reductase
MTKVGVAGYKGRVGQLLTEELQSGTWSPLKFGGGSERDTDLNLLFNDIDVLIDFTTPESTLAHIDAALENKTALIIGTTGLSEAEESIIDNAAQSVPVMYAANTSVGVNLISALIEKASDILSPDAFDIEINETHHRYKVDAPSGTALMLGKSAAKGRGVDLNTVKEEARSGHTGERKEGTIGFSVQRGGLVPGTHDVTFYGNEESVVISHIAHDRRLFAKGALKAAQWIQSQPAGLYTMRDVLGL